MSPKWWWFSACVCQRSWTQKTQPNGSSSVVWLRFWRSTRSLEKSVSANAETRVELIPTFLTTWFLDSTLAPQTKFLLFNRNFFTIRGGCFVDPYLSTEKGALGPEEAQFYYLKWFFSQLEGGVLWTLNWVQKKSHWQRSDLSMMNSKRETQNF